MSSSTIRRIRTDEDGSVDTENDTLTNLTPRRAALPEGTPRPLVTRSGVVLASWPPSPALEAESCGSSDVSDDIPWLGGRPPRAEVPRRRLVPPPESAWFGGRNTLRRRGEAETCGASKGCGGREVGGSRQFVNFAPPTMMASNNRLLSVSGPHAYKQRAIQDAGEQQKILDENLAKLGLSPSKYQFRELIGKGAYGRVYKSLHTESGRIVAVKVLETDAMDFGAGGRNKDNGIEDAMKEISVLQRLKESNAVNVNQFLESFQVHSQLWIVSEYCSGGSLSTLRRAYENKLSERYLVPIARELAAGLRSVHEAGIIHRDIKCANVMINEAGRLQIIDFGVAGILLSNLDVDKRKTVIGTPHWMAPELHVNKDVAHGTEVDVWAYGITLYECTMGAPPNAQIVPGRLLASRLRQTSAPRLPETFSTELQDLVKYVLEQDPEQRPSMSQICEHEYISNTEATHPTVILRELVEEYYRWESTGGQRTSLFMQGGAAKPKSSNTQVEEEEEWNFSTTANFEKLHADLDKALGLDNPVADNDINFSNMLSSSPPRDPDEYSGYPGYAANQPDAKRPGSSKGQTDADVEKSIARGARAMQGLFDSSAQPYQYSYSRQASDLPLRTGDSSSSLHRKELSVSSSNGGGPSINLDSIPSKRGKRSTMAWKWEDNLGNATLPAPAVPQAAPVRPVLKHAATMPVEPFNDRPVSEGLLDLDALMDEPSFATLPSSSAYPSAAIDPTASFDSNPPPEDDDEGVSYTMRPNAAHVPSTARRAQHSQMSSISSYLSAEDHAALHAPPRGSGPSPGPASNPPSTRASITFPPPIPAAALANDAPIEVMQEAFDQVMGGWMNMLQMNLEALGESDGEESEDEMGLEQNGAAAGPGMESGGEWSESGFAAGSEPGASREGSVEGSSGEDEGADVEQEK